MQSGHQPCPTPNAELQYIDPLPVIIKYAQANRLVMINESHYKPLHRLFIGELAKELREQGYTHYGAELLGGVDKTSWLNSDEGLGGKKYIADVRGFLSYFEEPVYAQVLEDLAKQEFSLFAYEGDTTNPPKGTRSSDDYRERLAAQNIDAYLHQYPDEKILIHTGYHHIKESNPATTRKWMAEQLKALNDIDPITISQTECYGEKPFDGGFLGYALLADKAGQPISRDGYDLIIAAPKTPQYRERPIWLRDHMGRRFVDVPTTARFDGPTDFTFITARRTDRPFPAAPEDIIYRAPYSDKVLALRPGVYDLDVTDRDKHLLKSVTITVE